MNINASPSINNNRQLTVVLLNFLFIYFKAVFLSLSACVCLFVCVRCLCQCLCTSTLYTQFIRYWNTMNVMQNKSTMIITFRFYWTHSHSHSHQGETREKKKCSILYTHSLYTSTTALNGRYIDNNNHKNTWITKILFSLVCFCCFFLLLQSHKLTYIRSYARTQKHTHPNVYVQLQRDTCI